jgi:hypothetical protein
MSAAVTYPSVGYIGRKVTDVPGIVGQGPPPAWKQSAGYVISPYRDMWRRVARQRTGLQNRCPELTDDKAC